MHRVSRAAVLILGLVFSTGLLAASEAGNGNTVVYLPSPAPDNSHLSRVTTDEDGQVFVSWVSQEGDTARLAHAYLNNARWSEPTQISAGEDWFINWADFPVLSVWKGNRVGHWLQKSADGTYDYDIVARFYDGEARRWSNNTTINTSGVHAEHGFVSMTPLSTSPSTSQTLLTWLDGRNSKGPSPDRAMTLRAAIFDAAGNHDREWQLDGRVCDCCQTSSAMTDKGPVVVYRDRSKEEVRDTSIVRFINGQWTQPAAVHRDGWRVTGCPVNGPSVAARQKAVAVAWFTARDEMPRVRLALSFDSGATFSEPVDVADSETNGRIDTAILDSGEIVVSWMELVGRDARIVLSRFTPRGEFLDRTAVAQVRPSRRSGFPDIAAVGNSVYVSWTEVTETLRVRVGRVDFKEPWRARCQQNDRGCLQIGEGPNPGL